MRREMPPRAPRDLSPHYSRLPLPLSGSEDGYHHSRRKEQVSINGRKQRSRSSSQSRRRDFSSSSRPRDSQSRPQEQFRHRKKRKDKIDCERKQNARPRKESRAIGRGRSSGRSRSQPRALSQSNHRSRSRSSSRRPLPRRSLSRQRQSSSPTSTINRNGNSSPVRDHARKLSSSRPNGSNERKFTHLSTNADHYPSKSRRHENTSAVGEYVGRLIAEASVIHHDNNTSIEKRASNLKSIPGAASPCSLPNTKSKQHPETSATMADYDCVQSVATDALLQEINKSSRKGKSSTKKDGQDMEMKVDKIVSKISRVRERARSLSRGRSRSRSRSQVKSQDAHSSSEIDPVGINEKRSLKKSVSFSTATVVTWSPSGSSSGSSSFPKSILINNKVKSESYGASTSCCSTVPHQPPTSLKILARPSSAPDVLFQDNQSGMSSQHAISPPLVRSKSQGSSPSSSGVGAPSASGRVIPPPPPPRPKTGLDCKVTSGSSLASFRAKPPPPPPPKTERSSGSNNDLSASSNSLLSNKSQSSPPPRPPPKTERNSNNNDLSVSSNSPLSNKSQSPPPPPPRPRRLLNKSVAFQGDHHYPTSNPSSTFLENCSNIGESNPMSNIIEPVVVMSATPNKIPSLPPSSISMNTKSLPIKHRQHKNLPVSSMNYTDPYGDSGLYSGEVDDESRPHGKGKMKYENGIFYQGNWINGYKDETQGNSSGHQAMNATRERILGGFTSWKGARKKDGEVGGNFNGRNFVYGLEWADLAGRSGKYTGQVNGDDVPHGNGVMRYEFGLVAEGEWIKGKLIDGTSAWQNHLSGMSVASGMSADGGAASVISGLGMMSIGGTMGHSQMNVGTPSLAAATYYNPAVIMAEGPIVPTGHQLQQRNVLMR